MRGKHTALAFYCGLLRITPADAGKTAQARINNSFLKDHPRGCGENRYWTRRRKNEIGSPPRMRGKHCEAANCTDDCRITPADAGKTLFLPMNLNEKTGSPPRMRGKPVSDSKRNVHTGITPADAGKTPGGYAVLQRRTDHPRGCGENCLPSRPSRDTQGSPPRMRGKPVYKNAHSERNRITPADAGKTCTLMPLGQS